MSEKEPIDIGENRNGEEEEYTVNEDAVNENAEGKSGENIKKDDEPKVQGRKTEIDLEYFVNKNSATVSANAIIEEMKEEEFAIKEFLNQIAYKKDLKTLQKGQAEVEKIIQFAGEQKKKIEKLLKPYREKDEEIVKIIHTADYLLKEMRKSRSKLDILIDNINLDQFNGKNKERQEQEKTHEEQGKGAKTGRKLSSRQKIAVSLAAIAAATTFTGVSIKTLIKKSEAKNNGIRTEYYDEGYNKGYKIGYEDGQQSKIEKMQERANNSGDVKETIAGAKEMDNDGEITDEQNKANVNKLLELIKQEIADRYGIEANDITINVERNSNGELQIKVTDKDGKEIPVDQEKEDEIKVFVEDYQNTTRDGTVTNAQKKEVQDAITTKESKGQEEPVKGKTITVLPEKEADDDTER